MPKLQTRFSTFYLAAFAFSLAALFLALATLHTSASSSPRTSAQAVPAAEARFKELQARLRDPRFLLLRVAVFDPVAEKVAPVRIGSEQLETTELRTQPVRTDVSAAAVPGADKVYLIIQYRAAIQPAWIESLRAANYEIVGYLPNHAFIIKASRAAEHQALSLLNREEVRWIGAYGPGLKVEPELAQMADQVARWPGANVEPSAAELTAISFMTFRGENSTAIQQALSQLALPVPALIEERFDGRSCGVVRVLPSQLPRLITTLAALEGVEWIERYQLEHLHNDNGVRIIQSGASGTDTPLYRHGLTGAGQVYGAVDSGLDTDHAQFRLDGQASSQTFSFATTSQDLVNGALRVKITNPNNKVLAYYLLGNGPLIDNPANPNGGKVLDPDAKSGNTFINSVAYDHSGAYHGTHTTSVAVGSDFNADGSGAVPGMASRSRGDGVAPDARIVFQDAGHPGNGAGIIAPSQALIHAQAYSSGVRIHNNSYGPNPPSSYGGASADIDDAMWRLRDYTIFYSAGNSGPGQATLGRDAKNHLLVAATDSPTSGGSAENLASFSSHGPAFDGRLKPDIAAPGRVIAATESDGLPSSFGNATSRTAQDAAINPSNPNNNRSFSSIQGTSFSSPMAAGGALLVRQYFVDGYYPSGARNAANGFIPSNALIKAILLNSGRNMTGLYTASDGSGGASGPLPNFGQGWGRITLDDALYFPGDRRELKVLADIFNGATAPDPSRPAPKAAITTGQTHTYQIENVSTIEPLRITLVWSDPRASIGATIALVNDLNLEVIDPQGKVYRGNVNFENAYSKPANNAPFDNLNPVEAVYIQFPAPGTYTVRIIGANVPGNGQMQVTAQPGDQPIDSNRQGYALIATGNFTAGAQAVLNLGATEVRGGVNADRFISRNETVTATVSVMDATVVPAMGVNVQMAVDAASQVPASLIRINGQPAGQSVTVNYGDIAPLASKALAFQITLLDDGINRAGQKITFNVTMTPTNGPATKTQFTVIAHQKLITYRTRFEPVPDPGGPGIIVIPEQGWGLRPDNPNPAPSSDTFAGPWQLTASKRSPNNGSTASLSGPHSAGSSYGVSTTSRSGGAIFDDSRYWTTQKVLLPGLTVDQSTGRVANPELAAQLQAAVESFEVDVSADFTGDINQTNFGGDLFFLRVRPYQNSARVDATDDSGFNSSTFTNLLLIDSTTPSTNGFKRFSGSSFAQGDGVFNASIDNPDVAFRLELQMRRNGATQTGEGIFVDNLSVRFRIADSSVYPAPASNISTSVDAASFTRSAAPGQILAAFGTGFPANTNINAAATSTPLPVQLGNVSVRVNGQPAPLFFVGVGGALGSGVFQINYQLPYETPPGVAFVEVLNNGVPITSEFLTVSATAPGVFTFSANGQGQAAALNQDYTRNGTPARDPGAKPEARGRIVIIFANGQGGEFVDAATRQPLTLASGVAAPSSPLYATASDPMVTIGGVPATVAFSGLAPGFVGLWQLNIVIPLNAPTGDAVPLVVTHGGRTSLTTTVAIN
jgi:uncharacterized protein (TIGR03437 family)